MQRLLFICGKNRRRSPTAETIFGADAELEVRSAGTAADADCPVDRELLEWADDVVVMEQRHRAQLMKRFSPVLRNKRVVCLRIPDAYQLMQPELVDRLHTTASRWKRGSERKA